MASLTQCPHGVASGRCVDCMDRELAVLRERGEDGR